MTFRRLIPCLLVLIPLAASTWLQNRSFAQNAYPGGNPGVAQPGTYNPSYPQPAGAGQAVGNQAVGNQAMGNQAMGNQAMGNQAVGNQNSVPPTMNMMDRPLGAPLQGGPPPGHPTGNPPGNPPQSQNARPILPPPAGFQIGKEKQDYIDRFLSVWQEQSKNIETLDYEFTRREYTSFGVSETYGRVKFHAPDKGLIEIDSELINGKKSYDTNKKMKVVCTGDAVYEFNFVEKKLTKFIIPAEERGKGVMDSPLMILAGANPRELQERFYLDAIPSPESLTDCVCLQAWPKWLDDSREFKSVTVAVNRQTFHAKVLLLFEPGGEGYKGYEITNTNPRRGGILPPLPVPKPKDEFDHNVIVNSKPKDWAFETKNDFLPEASGQWVAQQPYPPIPATPAPVNPPYGNPNMPGNNPINNTVVPGTGVSGYPGGNSPAIPPPGPMSGQTNVTGVPPYQVPAGNPPRPTGNTYLAMPPQGNTGSPSVLR